MTTETTSTVAQPQTTKVIHRHRGHGDAVYGLGFIGAAVYFIGHATTFWLGVLGFLKALVWPAFVIFELMKFLNM